MRTILENCKEKREAFEDVHNNPELYGSSSVGNVLGLNPYCTPLQEWVYRTGKQPRPSIDKLISVRRGNAMEPVLGELFVEVHGGEITAPDAIYGSDQIDWAIASPDFFWTSPAGERAIVEAKSAGYRQRDYWEDGGAPDYYQTQLLWQLGVCGMEQGYFSVIVGDDDHKTPELKFSQVIFDQILEGVEGFRQLVKRDIPPDALERDSQLVKAMFNHGNATEAQVEDSLLEEYLSLAEQIKTLGAPIKALESQREKVKNQLLQRANGANLLMGSRFRAKVSRSSYVMQAHEVNRVTLKAWEVTE